MPVRCLLATPGARLPSHAFVRCIRKQCFLRVGLLNRHLRGIDDWDMLVRIAELYPAMINGPACGYLSPADPTVEAGVIGGRATQLYAAVRHQLQLFRLPRVLSAAKRQRRKHAGAQLSRGRYSALECSWTIAGEGFQLCCRQHLNGYAP